MIDFNYLPLFGTQRQRWVLVATASLLFAYSVGTSEQQPLNLPHAAASIFFAVVAIGSWALPGSGKRTLRALLIGVAGIALVALERNGPGEAIVFTAVAIASFRLPSPTVLALIAGLTGALELELFLRGSTPLSLLLTLGGVALVALAVNSARLSRVDRERAREAELAAAVVEERSRLAREVHDVLAHSLTALVVQLDSARLLAEKRPSELPEALERARHLAQAGLDEARSAVEALRGDGLPGPDSLTKLLSDFEASSSMPTAFQVSGEPILLSPEARLALYRTTQESLTNIRKHSRAKRVTVNLAYNDGGAELSIEDSGGGPSELATTGSGYGLTGMRERAELAGGRLEAGPTEAGYRVKLWLPA